MSGLSLVFMYGFAMSGHATVDSNTAVNPVPGGKDVMPSAEFPASSLAGWWIVPVVALGAAFWALIISWVFGFG